jgi:hypothetical protein
MTVVYIIAAVAAIADLLYGFWTFDRLVRWEYDHHRDQWLKDGRPDWFFWRANECDFFFSSIAKQKLTFVWLFKTPAWADGNIECIRRLSHLRTAVLAWNTALATFAVAFSFLR